MFPVATILALCLGLTEVRAAGYLIDPPQRSSAWRLGYDTPINYNDMILRCGGFYQLWGVNGGKCGVCGDPWDGSRENEAGGKYATGLITGTYTKGEVLVAQVAITAFMGGWFEFRLCPVNNKTIAATQECLDQNLLPIVGNDTSRFDISNLGRREGIYEIHLQLPADVTCEQCVLQWKYNAGNNWGCESPSVCGLGYGPQEQFYNCADITIDDVDVTDEDVTPEYSTSAPETTARKSCRNNPNISCVPAPGSYQSHPGIAEYCRITCFKGHCPRYICSCTC